MCGIEEGGVSGSAVSIWFQTIHNESNAYNVKHQGGITHNAAWQLSDITGGNLSNFTNVVVLPKTCKHTV